MKNFKNLLLILIAVFTVQTVQAQDEATPKKEVKMIMIKKTIAEDGNETVEKIVKEVAAAEDFIFVDENGEEKDIRIIIKENEESKIDENIEIEINDEIRIKRKSVDIDVEEENGNKTIKIVQEDGDEVDVQVISLDEGQEIPASIRKKLAEHGIDLDAMRKESRDTKGKTKRKVKVITKEKKAY